MKTPPLFLFFILLFCFPLNALTQPGFNDGNALQTDSSQSVIFGYDIYINNQPDQDQQQVALCSALNGWLYSAYSYDNSGYASISVMQSQDGGNNWALLFDGSLGIHNCIFTKIDMVVAGNTVDELRVFLGLIFMDTTNQGGGAYVIRINGVTGVNEGALLTDLSGFINDIALATDQLYPALNSNPFSLGVLYTVKHNPDSVVFYSSGNGGISLDNRKVLMTGYDFFHKVDLAYGYSPSFSSGRYFAVWEEQLNVSANLGHIYTAHTEPNYNSPFTTPRSLDSLYVVLINQCRNPVIACQISDADNDSANITQVVLFEKYKPSAHDYDITGFYNLQAASKNNFRILNLASTASRELQPDISFNPFDSTFMVTYFDSTNRKLPFLTNDVDLENPDGWTVITNGYNDNPNVSAPGPTVTVNFGKQAGAVAWRAERTGGNGAAMFDAVYIYYTGEEETDPGKADRLFRIYPNPCATLVTIEFEVLRSENIKLTLYDLLGQPVRELYDQPLFAGKHQVKSDLTDLTPGIYICILKTGNCFASSKINIIR